MFTDTYYAQTFGSPMSSRLSFILTNFVLDYLIFGATMLTVRNTPLVKRFVDNLVLAVSENAVDEVLEVFNTQNSHIGTIHL